MAKNKPRPMFLYLRTDDIDNLFEGMKIVPRQNFIGLCKYNGAPTKANTHLTSLLN